MTELLILIIKVVIVLNFALGLGTFCTWFERKGSALIQDRVGANRAGSFFVTKRWYLKPFVGVMQVMGILGIVNTLFCDSVKGLFKEDFIPTGAFRFLHDLAPVLACLPIFLAFAVLPFGPDFNLLGYQIRPQLAPIDAGLLFILAMGSVSVYGPALAGWTGNNKYSLLGALRASAHMISYELALGLAIVGVVVCYGTLDLFSIVNKQNEMMGGWLPKWGVIVQPIGFMIFMIAGMAETKRAPFDLPEAESELSAGYFTEYSGMKFLLFWLGEFAEVALIAFILSLMFFGGWHLPFVELPENTWVGALIGHCILMGKVLFFCMLQIIIRWTLPRFRYDQLMHLGWKILLPLSLINVFITAAIVAL